MKGDAIFFTNLEPLLPIALSLNVNIQCSSNQLHLNDVHEVIREVDVDSVLVLRRNSVWIHFVKELLNKITYADDNITLPADAIPSVGHNS